MIQWIGIALAIFGMLSNFRTKNPQIAQITQQTNNTQPTQFNSKSQIAYTTINIAYDTNSGIYYFQHHDGNWHTYPPKP